MYLDIQIPINATSSGRLIDRTIEIVLKNVGVCIVYPETKIE